MRTQTVDSRTVLLQVEVPILAPLERVWHALVEDTGVWWPREFYTDAQARSVVLEARPGGRMFEDWGEGGGRVWYTVMGLQPGRMLELAGHLQPAMGGPATSLVQVTLEERKGGGTLLRLVDALQGRVSDQSAVRAEEGWRALLAGAFKTYVERPETPRV
jgi:uncharacterized protein YndB with AHSA1/START domain